ncbi:FHA domain-containing protein [Myxococcota bacterium]|nr:FHA domain-containing protein [Myxococcota bacterium]
MPQLVIISPEGEEQRLTIERGGYIVGRESGNDIHISGQKVSRQHAKLFWKGSSFWVEDLGSANGVIINGSLIRKAHRMTPGVQVDIGGFVLSISPDEDNEPKTFMLLGLTAPFLKQSFVLPPGELSVGRVQGNSIIIPDKSISRDHAKLIVSTASVLVEDNGSSNGTFVSGIKISRRKLRAGDRIKFGNVEFEFKPQGEGFSPFQEVRKLWNRFLEIDRPLQLASIIGILSIFLLVITVVVALKRNAAPSLSNQKEALLSARKSTFEKAVQQGLHNARLLMQQQAWVEAQTAYNQVLSKDPINAEARNNIAIASRNMQDKSALEVARGAFQHNQPETAAAQVKNINLTGPYGRAAQSLSQEIHLALATKNLTVANESCKKKKWRPCHLQAIEALKHKPGSARGLALVRKSESGMRSKRIKFTPYTPGAGVDTSMTQRYSDGDVLTGAIRYGTGDLTGAIKIARTQVGKAGAAALLDNLGEFRTQKTAGDGAAAAGDTQRAIAGWEKALIADSRIIPPTQKSIFRDQLLKRIAIEYYRMGDAAFNRAANVDARIHWEAGLRRSPNDPQLRQAAQRLQQRAQALFASLPPAGQALSPAQCAKLGEVVNMTMAHWPLHQQAAPRLSTCPR